MADLQHFIFFAVRICAYLCISFQGAGDDETHRVFRVAPNNNNEYKENFPLFDELAPMLPTECREEGRKTMQLLENVWHDDLCKATIVMITKGKRKAYKKSRVMRMMFAKVIKTLSPYPLPLKGEGVVTKDNSNNR